MTTLIDEKAAGQLDEALKHFTKCLEGVDAANTFTKLPHCLREVRPTDYSLLLTKTVVLLHLLYAASLKSYIYIYIYIYVHAMLDQMF